MQPFSRPALVGTLLTAFLLGACSHPIEIIGVGDVVSATGDRDCLYEEHAAAASNCTENLVTEAYHETYYAVPRPGWQFHRWANYCVGDPGNACRFDVPEEAVDLVQGETAPPLVAIFRPTVNTGLNSLFIGHSFFVPYALRMDFHVPNAGFADHEQQTVFAGGANGAPQALWEDPANRARIQGILDGGDIQLFGMTYFPTYPSLEGYRNWVDYALARNPDTRFFIAMPWEPFPLNTDAETYESNWETFHPAISHDIVDNLKLEYPGVEFFCVPYGQAAVELRKLYAAGNLPDVTAHTSNSEDAIFVDALGHADHILVALGELVWLRALYGVKMSDYDFEPNFQADLKGIADAIMEEHEHAYNAPWLFDY